MVVASHRQRRFWKLSPTAETVLRIAYLLIALPMIGMFCFHWIEGWSLFDSLYMAMITLTTVGYMEVQPLSTAGRTFVMIYLVAGIGVFSYSVARLGEMVVRLELRNFVEERRMRKTIEAISSHYIVCGFGRMGLALCRQLDEKELPFVVVDRSAASVDECKRRGWLYVVGDATEDRVLQSAGIERAQGLAAVLSSDADNLFVVLSARLLVKELYILSRATEESSVNKLEKAGANRVIPLFETSAYKMAQLLSHPDSGELLDAFQTEGAEFEVAQIHINAASPYLGKRIDQTDLRKLGVIVLGVRRPSGELLSPAPGTFLLSQDDRLVAVGHPSAIDAVVEQTT
jgi:voltage-gated potassium channel